MSSSADRWNRLLLEGLVIVASILLAFAIDAWWDERQERAAEERLLTALEVEFTQHVGEVTESVEIHRRLALLTEELFDTLAVLADGTVLLPDSLVYPTMRARTTEIAQGELQAALASGSLDLIRDPELRRRLAGWPGLWTDAVEEEVWAVEFFLGRLGAELARSPDVSVSLMEGLRAGTSPTDSGSDATREVRNSPELRSALAMRYTLELGAWLGMETARREARTIRDQLRSRLALPPLSGAAEEGATQDPLEN